MIALLACCMLGGHSKLYLHGCSSPTYAPFCPTWRTNLFNFLYFKRQRCRTSLLIFSFFILSPSLLCVCISFPTSHCLFYVGFTFCLPPHLMDGCESTPFHCVFPFRFHFTFMLEPPQWSRHHILCMSPHSVCPLWPLLPSSSPPLRPCPSLQHWDQGGGNSEEPERLIAHT